MAANMIVTMITILGIVAAVEFHPFRNNYRNTVCKVLFIIYWMVLVVFTITLPVMWIFYL